MSFRTLKQRFGITPNYKQLLAAGQITLAAGIILSRLELQFAMLDFTEGMLFGFSIVTNLAGIILFGRIHRGEGENNG